MLSADPISKNFSRYLVGDLVALLRNQGDR
jgi:hypothetical protein